MIDDKLMQHVASELAKIFECDVADIHAETCAADIEKWDSMNNVKMLLQLEKVFGIRFSGMEALSLENVGELVELIQPKLLAKAG